jgi:hypothetical protein
VAVSRSNSSRFGRWKPFHSMSGPFSGLAAPGAQSRAGASWRVVPDYFE